MKKDGSSSLSQARRQLDFREKPFQLKTFYLNVKAEDLKKKVTRRLKELGGQIEEFLSKDVKVVLTDSPVPGPGGGAGSPTERTVSQEKDKKMSSVPLSRGKALLLKAAEQRKAQSGTHTSRSMDILQNALNLGVKVEQASDFLKLTQKLAGKLRRTKPCEKLEDIEGIKPIHWQKSENQNVPVLKFEDEGQLYKPVIKHLEKFPQIQYNENLLSPFDKSVILQRTTEKHNNRYAAKHKNSAVVSHKGGFCEPCDYWYKCSLREHLNSVRHQKFVKNFENFIQLDAIISKMPSIADFTSKFIPSNLQNAQKIDRVLNVEDDVFVTNCEIPNIDDIEMRERKGSCSNAVKTPMDISNTSVADSVRLQTMSPGKSISCSEKIMTASLGQSFGQCQKESEMEVETAVITKDIVDECSKDSGTGPELGTEITCDRILDDHFRKMNAASSDSALPQEPHALCKVNSESTINSAVVSTTVLNDGSGIHGCDNAVFLDLTDKTYNLPVQTATSTIRKKLSAVSISDSSSKVNNTALNSVIPGNQSDLALSSLTFSGIDALSFVTPTSPKSRNTEPSFGDVTAGWMKDMLKKSDKKLATAMNKENLDSSAINKKQRKPRTKKVGAKQKRKCKASVTSYPVMSQAGANDVLSFYQNSLSLNSELTTSAYSDTSCQHNAHCVDSVNHSQQSQVEWKNGLGHHQSSQWNSQPHQSQFLHQTVSNHHSYSDINMHGYNYQQNFQHSSYNQPEKPNFFSESCFQEQPLGFHGQQYFAPFQPHFQNSSYYPNFNNYHNGIAQTQQNGLYNSPQNSPIYQQHQAPQLYSENVLNSNNRLQGTSASDQHYIELKRSQSSALNTGFCDNRLPVSSVRDNRLSVSSVCDNRLSVSSVCDNRLPVSSVCDNRLPVSSVCDSRLPVMAVSSSGPRDQFSGLNSDCYSGNTVPFNQSSQVDFFRQEQLTSTVNVSTQQNPTGLPRPFLPEQEENSLGSGSAYNLNSDTEGYAYSGQSLSRSSHPAESRHSLSSISTEASTESYAYSLPECSSFVQKNMEDGDNSVSLSADQFCAMSNADVSGSEIIDVVSIDDENTHLTKTENCVTPTNSFLNKRIGKYDDLTPTNSPDKMLIRHRDGNADQEVKISSKDKVTNQQTDVSQRTPAKTDGGEMLAFSVKSILSNRTSRTPTQTPASLRNKWVTPKSPSHNKKSVGNFQLKEKPLKHQRKSIKRKRRLSGKTEDEFSSCQYVARPQGGIKLKLCKVIVTPIQQKNDLKSFWKVRKAGGCRLLFSAEKNKDMTRGEQTDKRISVGDIVQQTKRQKCSV